jgi:hypothetical protein
LCLALAFPASPLFQHKLQLWVFTGLGTRSKEV